MTLARAISGQGALAEWEPDGEPYRQDGEAHGQATDDQEGPQEGEMAEALSPIVIELPELCYHRGGCFYPRRERHRNRESQQYGPKGRSIRLSAPRGRSDGFGTHPTDKHNHDQDYKGNYKEAEKAPSRVPGPASPNGEEAGA